MYIKIRVQWIYNCIHMKETDLSYTTKTNEKNRNEPYTY